LVDGELLPSLAALVGKQKEVHEITAKGIAGKINWEEGLARRIEYLKGITYEQCVEVSSRLPMMEGAEEMASYLKRSGCLTIGISGGFSILADRVQERLGLDHVFSNELVFHLGKLCGYGLTVNANKTQILKTAFGNIFESRKKIAVVDGANDLQLFDVADVRVAFNAQRVVRDVADISIGEKDLRAILPILKAA
jgi:phosphoserine phosphatase